MRYSADQAACTVDAYNLACLESALVVTVGSWTTPIVTSNGQRYDLSHLTFYNSEQPVTVQEPGIAAPLMMGVQACS